MENFETPLHILGFDLSVKATFFVLPGVPVVLQREKSKWLVQEQAGTITS